MAYLQQTSNNQRAVTLSAVAALHVGVLYAVVTGLAVTFVPDLRPIVETWDVKIEEKKIKPPEDNKADKTPAETTQRVETDTAIPPINNYEAEPLTIGPTGGEEDVGGGMAEVELPRPPVPDPRPLFTAKAPKARGNQGNWVRQSDYPSIAIREGHQGLTKVKLEVNALGRVTRCTITAGSGHDELDAAACAKLTDRARFDPASDTSGAKTEGIYTTSVRWQLPE